MPLPASTSATAGGRSSPRTSYGNTKGWAPAAASRQSRGRQRRHLGGGLRQVLERVHGAPVGAAAVTVEFALGGQLGEGRRLVVAAVGQPAQELPRRYVQAGVDPVRQERLLVEGGDTAAAVQAGDAVWAAGAGKHDGGGGLLAPVVAEEGRQRLVGQDIAVEGDDGVFARGQKPRPQLEGAAASQRLLLQGVVHSKPEAGAVPEVPLDDLRLVAAEQDRVADAMAGQPAYLVLEDGLARDLDHRLGPVAGEGPQALALAARDDQGIHRQIAAGFIRLAWAPDPPPCRSPDSFAD